MKGLKIVTVLLGIGALVVVFYPVGAAVIHQKEPNVYKAYIKENCIEVTDPQAVWYACDLPDIQGTYNAQVTVNGKELQ